jgi:hypothetical protein
VGWNPSTTIHHMEEAKNYTQTQWGRRWESKELGEGKGK